MDLRKALHDPWVWGQFALIGLVALVAPLLPRLGSLGDVDYALNRMDPTWIRALGGLVGGAGLALAGWGIRSLGPSLTPGTEPLPNAPLVTGRAYGYLRHPIYGGVVLLLAGYTLAWSNWTLALILGFVALRYFEAKAGAEERWLAERYPEYQRYAVHVRRRVL
ncbi:MAG: isoprenylcysteine carboxylmethyltransferase family protein [Gemmatimonadales bacterium]